MECGISESFPSLSSSTSSAPISLSTAGIHLSTRPRSRRSSAGRRQCGRREWRVKRRGLVIMERDARVRGDPEDEVVVVESVGG